VDRARQRNREPRRHHGLSVGLLLFVLYPHAGSKRGRGSPGGGESDGSRVIWTVNTSTPVT
jgi:hypothetical protein